ncbi:MYXO-CTERM sorting domain-containing protein [Nannocystis pusilla]|uniref:MYXO-CTERM sorting domain-containing protein n=1 Tax=Nannocystis pusilla TaxID=889268 RepID=UPI003BF426F7
MSSAAALGCTGANSEEGQMHVSLAPLFYSAVNQPSGLRALQGSTVCFDAGLPDSPDDGGFDGIEGCFDMAIAGVPFVDADCVTLDGPSGVQVDYTPRADCAIEEAELFLDRFRVEVVPVDGLRARLEWHLEHLAEHFGERLTSRPADLIPGADEPLRLVPDFTVGFPVNVIDAAGERVGWDLSQGRVLETKGGGPARPLALLEDTDVLWPVRVGPGETSTITLEVAGAVLPVATVVATPAEAAASLEIVAALADAPLGARAIVRDAEGRVLVGAPVTWSLVEGELALTTISEFTPPEYTMIADDCAPPPTAPESRRAVLRAQLGALSDELEIEWTVKPPEETSDEPFSPDPACQRGTGRADDGGLGDRGCNCATGPQDGRAGWAWLAALTWMIGRRRRTSPAR